MDEDELKQGLWSFVKRKEGKSDEEVLESLYQMLELNQNLDATNAELARHIEHTGQIYEFGINYIKENPGNWYEQLDQTLHPRKPARKTSMRISFEGQRIKTVTDETGKTTTYQKDSKGEYLPVEKQEKQASDTSILLEKIAAGDMEGIEDMGYKIKRTQRDEEDDKEEKKE